MAAIMKDSDLLSLTSVIIFDKYRKMYAYLYTLCKIQDHCVQLKSENNNNRFDIMHNILGLTSESVHLNLTTKSLI